MTDTDSRLDEFETERALTRLVYDYCHGIEIHHFAPLPGVTFTPFGG